MTSTDQQLTPADRPAVGITRWSDAALGAALAAEEATADLVRDLRELAERQQKRLAELAERGAVERARYRRRTTEAAEYAVTVVAAAPLIDRIVDRQIQRILRPVVLAVLDDVLLLLEKEPDRIQSLIRGQRESMADELVDRLRAGAAAGDAAVDRLTFRVFRRAHRPEPPDL